MTALTIRDIPDNVLTAVKVHADECGKSLETYVLEVLAHDAYQSRPLTQINESRGHRAASRLSGSANNPETRGMTTDQLIELLRGD